MIVFGHIFILTKFLSNLLTIVNMSSKKLNSRVMHVTRQKYITGINNNTFNNNSNANFRND